MAALTTLASETKVYPVLTLPNEITTEIFTQYLPVYPACPPLFGDGSPTKLGQICRHWREIALSTPTLWCAIALFTNLSDLKDEDLARRQLAAAQIFLERSRSRLLSVMMARHDPDSYSRLRCEALGYLLAHRERFEYLTLGVPDILGEVMLPSESLIAIDIFSYKEDLDAVSPPDFPALRTAYFDLETESYQQLLPRVPVAQLTRLMLQNIGPLHATEVLKEAVHLVHCRLQLWDEAEFDVRSLGYTIRLDHLETLILESDTGSDMDPVDFGPCLDALRLPRLHRFCIDEYILISEGQILDTSIYPIPILSGHVQRFGCVVKAICILRPSEATPDEYRAITKNVGP
ncbi:hypothetical protein C8F01DRAFT_1098885 [Mycena amicta]|nr:hypothetical protein C8F01DRAFT_1098885 [Mycena amicta]